jgi:hypothetical protein
LSEVAISGADPVWLEVTSEETMEEIVYLRFVDSEGWVVLERRLSVAPGQTAVNDVSAYGLLGDYTLEVVSSHKISASLAEPAGHARRNQKANAEGVALTIKSVSRSGTWLPDRRKRKG